MPRRTLQLRLRTAAALAVCAACTATFAVSGSGSGGGEVLQHTWLRPGTLPALSPVAIGTQGPPPPITPAVLHLFMDLVVSYEAIGSNIPVNFGEWIVMNGITDLRTQWCLMWLWWNLGSQSAVD